MKKNHYIFLIFISFYTLFNQNAFSQHITAQEIFSLAKKKTVEGITTLLNQKNFYLDEKLKYTADKYYGDDEVIYLVYCYNCNFTESSTGQHVSYDGSFSLVIIYYNVTKSKIEDLTFWFSSKNTFMQTRKLMSTYGYKYLGEDLTSSDEGIIYKYKNEAANIQINVKEKTEGSYLVYVIK